MPWRIGDVRQLAVDEGDFVAGPVTQAVLSASGSQSALRRGGREPRDGTEPVVGQDLPSLVRLLGIRKGHSAHVILDVIMAVRQHNYLSLASVFLRRLLVAPG